MNGGFYLKGRHGESLVALLWGEFLGRLRTQLEPPEDLSLVVDAVEPNETLASFTHKLNYTNLNEKVNRLETKYQEWVRSKRVGEFEILFLFYVILKFEVNRIYSFWYGDEGDFPREECAALFRELNKCDLDQKLQAKLVAYIHSFKARGRAFGDRKA